MILGVCSRRNIFPLKQGEGILYTFALLVLRKLLIKEYFMIHITLLASVELIILEDRIALTKKLIKTPE